jgi:hypothetical protein
MEGTTRWFLRWLIGWFLWWLMGFFRWLIGWFFRWFLGRLVRWSDDASRLLWFFRRQQRRSSWTSATNDLAKASAKGTQRRQQWRK